MSVDVKEIAGRLTESQREALTGSVDVQDLGYLTKAETGRSAKAIHRYGLTWLGWAPSTLTPLGLAVRNHLLATEPTA